MKFGSKKELEEKQSKEKETVDNSQDWIIDPSKKKKEPKEKKPKEQKGDGKKSNTVLIIVGVLAIILGGIAFLLFKGRTATPVDNTPKEIKKGVNPLEDISNAINRMYANGAMIGVDIDPDEDLSIIYYFDSNGKAYAESPYINGLYVEKDRSLTEKQDGNGEYYFSMVDDMTPLYLIENIVKVAGEKDKGIVTDITTDEESEVGCRSYQVDIRGVDIASVFNAVSSNYCLEQVKTLYNIDNPNNLDIGNILRLLITTSDEDGHTAAAVLVIKDNTPYILYNFEGYTSLGGWELDASVWNKDMKVDNYKGLREKYIGVQTFCGAQIEKWLTEHPEVLDSLGNRLETDTKSTQATESNETDSEN